MGFTFRRNSIFEGNNSALTWKQTISCKYIIKKQSKLMEEVGTKAETGFDNGWQEYYSHQLYYTGMKV
jgi:hypothetical protein